MIKRVVQVVWTLCRLLFNVAVAVRHHHCCTVTVQYRTEPTEPPLKFSFRDHGLDPSPSSSQRAMINDFVDSGALCGGGMTARNVQVFSVRIVWRNKWRRRHGRECRGGP